MTLEPSSVLDSSALLALLRDERGADAVEEAIRLGAAMSAVNLEEVLTKLSDGGQSPESTAEAFAAAGILPGSLAIAPLDEAAARASSGLRPSTRGAGLSLGDRACLSLARDLGLPALTADRAWAALKVGVKVVCVR